MGLERFVMRLSSGDGVEEASLMGSVLSLASLVSMEIADSISL